MAVSAQIRSVTVRCPFEHIVVGFHKQKTCVLRALRMQVAQLQKLIGEKDAQIHDVKAKSRDLQVCVRQCFVISCCAFCVWTRASNVSASERRNVLTHP